MSGLIGPADINILISAAIATLRRAGQFRATAIACRKHIMTKRVQWSILSVAVILVCALTAYKLIHFRAGNGHHLEIQRIAADEDSSNIWKRDDYIHFRAIEDNFESSGSVLSPQDFSWLMLHLTNQTSPKDNPTLDRARILGLFSDAHLNPEQKAAVSNSLLSLLAQPDAAGDSNGLVKIYACRVERAVKDQRAVPLLLNLRGDSRPYLHHSVEITLKALGYHLQEPA